MKTAGVLAVVLLGGMTAAVWAQQTPQTPPNCAPGQDSTVEKPCTPVSAIERFPFPGESTGGGAAPAVNAPTPNAGAPDAPAPNAPAPAGAGDASSSAAKRFPFPGDANAGPSSSTSASGSSDSSSSSSSNSDSSSSADSSDDGDAAAGDTPDTPKLKDKGSSGGRGRNQVMKQQTPVQRVDEDLQVGEFYRNDGNFAGAYLRAKDAFALMPDDEDVNLLYAEAALKLDKKDEALEHYRAYLKIDPKGKKADEAQQAIKKLTSSKK